MIEFTLFLDILYIIIILWRLPIQGAVAMMGRQPPHQNKLFMCNITLDSRIRKGHILRKIKEKIDFDFIYEEVTPTYGTNGSVC